MTALLRTLSTLARQRATAEARQLACYSSQTSSTTAAQQDIEKAPGGSWMPSWLKSRLPGVLGGTREYDELEDLDLDKFAKTLKQARQLGSLTGFVSGSSQINDPMAKGNLRMYESIVGAMTTEEKHDLRTFGPASKQRVAAAAGCTVAQVDDCLAKYQWMKTMTSRVAKLKKEGKPIPKTVEEVEQQLGNWRSFKQESLAAKGPAAQAAPSASGAGGVAVPLNAMGPKVVVSLHTSKARPSSFRAGAASGGMARPMRSSKGGR
ncbi:hypothetical protein WJX72_003095 [[Myrmecia] bisecta]|uniref:Signal recognition particle SRP54 subunit M-domain domain-containing protein n=1 Tax=[Myrmecia] bisecta TaxID=41462 RepID=A0AAW1PIQ2_9CHLO